MDAQLIKDFTIKLIKSDNTQTLTFFVSMMTLAIFYDLVPNEVLFIFFIVSICLTFGSVAWKVILTLHRHTELYLAETKELVKKKEFSAIEKTVMKQAADTAKTVLPKPTNLNDIKVDE